MVEINKLVELINRPESNRKIERLFKKSKDELFKEVRSLELFRAYLKSAVLTDFIGTREEQTLDIMQKQLENTSIFSDYYTDVVFLMNASVSKVGDKTGRVKKSEIDILFSYEDCPSLEDLDDREDEIIHVIKELSGYVTYDEIINGDYKKSKGYSGNALTVGEVRKLSLVKMIPDIINIIHRKYDDQTDGDVCCLYGDIEEDYLKRFAFHTDKVRSCFLIVFDDDTIISYNKGEYRYLPYLFSHVVYLTKLCILSYLDIGADDDEEDMTLRMLAKGEEYTSMEIEDMDKKLFEQLTIFAYDYVRSVLDEFTYEFSEVMVDDAKRMIKKYKGISKEYRF